MVALATAFVNVRPDLGQFKTDVNKGMGDSGTAAGKAFGEGFTRDVNGRLRDERGRFVKTWSDHGDAAGKESAKRFSGGFSGGLGGVAKGLTAAFAVLGGVHVFSDFISEARESINTGKLTEAVLKSTGNAAHITASQVGDLANAISLKVGVDDEAIQSAENLLLTFKDVRNEAGAGNDIFNQSTQAIVDMTAAMNHGEVTTEGMKASTIQLGKALNDPVKGITALTRVGVTFTQQQKDQITQMVNAGNTLGAQKIILKEVQSEFGGAAAAAADPVQKMQVAWKNFEETVGLILLPMLTALSNWITNTGLPAVQSFGAGLAPLIPAVRLLGSTLGMALGWLGGAGTLAASFRGALGGLVVGVLAVAAAVKVWSVIQAILDAELLANPIGLIVIAIAALVGAFIAAYQHSQTFRNIVQGAWNGIRIAAIAAWNFIRPILQAMWTFISVTLMPVWQALLRGVRVVWQGIQFAIDHSWVVIRPIWFAIRLYILALKFEFNLLWTIAKLVWSGIRIAISIAWAIIKPIWFAIRLYIQALKLEFNLFWTIAKLVWSGIRVAISIAWAIIRPIWAAIKLYIQALKIEFNIFWFAVQVVWAGIRFSITNSWNAIKIVWALIKLGIQALKLQFNLFLAAIRLVWSGVRLAITFAWNLIRPIFNLIRTVVQTVLIAAFNQFRSNASIVWSGVRAAISAAWNGISGTFNALKAGVNACRTAFSIAVSAIRSIWDGLKAATRGPVSFVVNTVYMGGIRKVWEGVRNVVPGLPDLPSVQFATGGIFPGYSPGVDDIAVPMAAFSGGEGVIRPEFTRALGEDFINGGNRAAVQGGTGAVLRFLGGFGDAGGTGFHVAQRFADGGILGKIKGILTAPGRILRNVTGTIVTKGVDWFAHNILDPITHNIPGGNSPWVQAMAYLPKAMINGFLTFIKNVVSPNLMGGATAVVQAARAMIGTPYSWGGGGIGGPSTGIGRGAGTVGFDCSGLTEYAWWKGAHIDIGGWTGPQAANSTPISGPRAGALGFVGSPIHHVMLGSDKPGYVIQAPFTGSFVQEVQRSTNNWHWPHGAKFDKGGWLPVGPLNGRRNPEPVLTDQQWADIHTLAMRGAHNAPTIGTLNVTGLPDIPSDKQIANAIERNNNLHGKRW